MGLFIFIYLSNLLLLLLHHIHVKDHGLINLASILSKQHLATPPLANVNSISNILKSNCIIYNANNVIFNTINNLSRRNDCVIDL